MASMGNYIGHHLDGCQRIMIKPYLYRYLPPTPPWSYYLESAQQDPGEHVGGTVCLASGPTEVWSFSSGVALI
jgi:hypothetical protein